MYYTLATLVLFNFSLYDFQFFGIFYQDNCIFQFFINMQFKHLRRLVNQAHVWQKHAKNRIKYWIIKLSLPYNSSLDHFLQQEIFLSGI